MTDKTKRFSVTLETIINHFALQTCTLISGKLDLSYNTIFKISLFQILSIFKVSLLSSLSSYDIKRSDRRSSTVPPLPVLAGRKSVVFTADVKPWWQRSPASRGRMPTWTVSTFDSCTCRATPSWTLVWTPCWRWCRRWGSPWSWRSLARWPGRISCGRFVSRSWGTRLGSGWERRTAPTVSRTWRTLLQALWWPSARAWWSDRGASCCGTPRCSSSSGGCVPSFGICEGTARMNCCFASSWCSRRRCGHASSPRGGSALASTSAEWSSCFLRSTEFWKLYVFKF